MDDCLKKVMQELKLKWSINKDMFKTIRVYN